MPTFKGDHKCKVDAKGRILLPSSFRKLLVSDSEGCCVLRKNLYENCIDLFSSEAWERQVDIVYQKANRLSRKKSGFIREFFRDTAELSIDNSGRILIPKKFFDKVDLGKEVMLAGQRDKIEIWNATAYEESAWSEEDFSNYADEVLGSDSSEIL